MSEQLSKEELDFLSWKDHPVTEKVYALFARRRDKQRHDWEAGVFQRQTAEETHIANANALGYCNALAELEDLDYPQLETELNDE